MKLMMRIKYGICFCAQIAIMSLLALASCQQQDSPVHDGDIDYESLKENSVKEFLAFARNPRPSHSMEKPREYLKAFAEENGWSWHRDEYGSCWFDVPATEGYRNYPNVILQGHMDMVCASAEGETHDYLKEVGTPHREGDLIRGEHINLGVDDGIGVGMILAIAKSDIGHGPLRCLFTADEETGLFGAANLSPSTINSDYLISLDAEMSAYVDISCAGSVTLHFEDDLEAAGQLPDKSRVTVEISGLRGGHSGIEINNHRLSAGVMIIDMLGRLIDSYEVNAVGIDAGTANNAILTGAELAVAVNPSDEEGVRALLLETIGDYAEEYPDETIIYSISSSAIGSSDHPCSARDTRRMHQLLSGLKYGPVEVRDGHVTKSSNISPIILKDCRFSVNSLMRSDYNEWLDEQARYYVPFAGSLGMAGSIFTQCPAWYCEHTYPMVSMLKGYYSAAIGGTVADYMSQAGLEPAYFSRIRPDLQIACIGPQIDNAHTIVETLHIDTLVPVLKATVQTIQHINEL